MRLRDWSLFNREVEEDELFWKQLEQPSSVLHGVLACLNRLQQLEILCGDGLLSREYSALDDAHLDVVLALSRMCDAHIRKTRKI
jgi:hypothetical protein